MKMPMAAVAEMVARSQPKCCCRGSIKTDGAERTPAATSSARNVTAVTATARWRRVATLMSDLCEFDDVRRNGMQTGQRFRAQPALNFGLGLFPIGFGPGKLRPPLP